MLVSSFISNFFSKSFGNFIGTFFSNLVSTLFSNFFSNLVSNLMGYVIEAGNKFTKTTFISMFRDERGVVEPQSDLLSTVLAVIGFVVLAALMSQAYFGYEDRSFALENYESASLLADTLAAAPALKTESSNVMSAAALDKLSDPEGIKEKEKLFAAFSGNYPFIIEIRTEDELRHWRIEPGNSEPGSFRRSRKNCSFRACGH